MNIIASTGLLLPLDRPFDTPLAHNAVALALLTGVGLGAVAVQGLQAQAKPPAYVIAEIDVTDQDAYAKEYQPAASKALREGGAKFLARGSKTRSFKGEPSKRIVLFAFEKL